MLERAIGATWLARHADLPAMVNNLVRELNPAISGEHAYEVLLDLHRLFLLGELQTA